MKELFLDTGSQAAWHNPWEKQNKWSHAFDGPRLLPGESLQATAEGRKNSKPGCLHWAEETELEFGGG